MNHKFNNNVITFQLVSSHARPQGSMFETELWVFQMVHSDNNRRNALYFCSENISISTLSFQVTASLILTIQPRHNEPLLHYKTKESRLKWQRFVQRVFSTTNKIFSFQSLLLTKGRGRAARRNLLAPFSCDSLY